MPNIALIETLKKSRPTTKISYIGSKTGLEAKLLAPYPVKFYSVETGKLRRYFDLKNFVDIFRVPVGFVQSFKILKKIHPDLVFSKGGYVALPVVFAAFLLRIPVIIHESDSIPGLTTRLSAFVAKQVWASHDSIAKVYGRKFKQVELPVREFLFEGQKEYFNSKLDLNPTKKNLLVMGGSLGAGALNQFVSENLSGLSNLFNIIHICGKGKVELQENSDQENYYQFEYLDEEMNHAYAFADYILSRAGASAISELTALQKKSILVPLPNSASRGEQIINAQKFSQNKLGEMILEDNLNFENFMNSIQNLDKLDPKQIQSHSAKFTFSPDLFDQYDSK
jgi:UDP-N-acetylglucosamine--N-acetylmuramyl-(pentapeptide) pyrophosphoryl-undecaprenol N-acetylglucosamine transferase